MDNRQERIAKIVCGMFTFYDKANAERMALYVQMLCRLKVAVEVIDEAVQRLVLKSVFLPQVAEIVAEVDAITKPDAALPWDEAWNIINREMRRNWQNPNFERAEIAAAVKSYGWGDICSCYEKDLPYIKAQLRQVYENICNRKADERREALVITSTRGKQIDGAIKGVLKAW